LRHPLFFQAGVVLSGRRKIFDHAESVMNHGMAQIEPGLRIHYVTAGAGDRTIVLVHGFPQTWWEWRQVIPLLVQAGFRVIALDYRGAGASSRPQGGYDKRSMAKDIHVLLHQHLQVQQAVIVVGHDIGSMVAFAYAEMFREEVSHLVVMDAPLPGTAIFDRLRADPRVWHFAFHGARDIPEMLVVAQGILLMDFHQNDVAMIQSIIARVAHSFDLEAWPSFGRFYADQVETDYKRVFKTSPIVYRSANLLGVLAKPLSR
jgi:pimeloyl-ACP methyl ester carboxylesterase